jgi:methionyl-tRNA synthetase
MTESKRYTITAALPYTNGPTHWPFGWCLCAFRYLFRYLIARKRRFVCLRKIDTVLPFPTKEGITPQEVIDKYDGIIRKSFSDFGISFDNYSELRLKFITILLLNFFTTLYEKDFIEQVTEQLYDAKADQFLADRFVVGTAQMRQRRYGDQCEQCGSTGYRFDQSRP